MDVAHRLQEVRGNATHGVYRDGGDREFLLHCLDSCQAILRMFATVDPPYAGNPNMTVRAFATQFCLQMFDEEPPQ